MYLVINNLLFFIMFHFVNSECLFPEKELKNISKIKLKSLILAQNERWR